MRRFVQHSFWAARRFNAQTPHSTRVSLLPAAAASSNATAAAPPTVPAAADFDEGAAVFHVAQGVLAICSHAAVRAAFHWVNTHTARDATLLSWVDHGHAITETTGELRVAGDLAAGVSYVQAAPLQLTPRVAPPALLPSAWVEYLSLKRKTRQRSCAPCRFHFRALLAKSTYSPDDIPDRLRFSCVWRCCCLRA